MIHEPDIRYLEQPLLPLGEPETSESTEPRDVESTLEEVLGKGLLETLGGVFDRMEIAEEEIERAKSRWPERRDEIHGAFHLLVPTTVLGEAPDLLYRRHVREVLERVAEARDPDRATDSECLAALRATSLVAPLRHDAFVAYARLFSKLFPEEARRLGADLSGTESYSGAVEELLEGLRRKLSGPRSCHRR